MQSLNLLNLRLRRALIHLPYVPRALALAWKATRAWTLTWSFLLLLQGLLPVATVYLSRSLVDRLVPALGSGGNWQGLTPVLVPLGLLAAVLLLTELLRIAATWVRTAQAELLKDHISALIHTKSIEADLAFYDQPEFYDHLHRARDEAGYRPVQLLESLGSLLQNAITLVAMSVVLIPFGIWIPAAVLISTLPALFVVLRYTLAQHEWRHRTTADERRSWYFDWLLTSREAASELRLFGMGPRFHTNYQALRQGLRRERMSLAQQEGLAELAAGGFGLLVAGAAMVWMVWKATRGLVSLGDLTLFYQAFNQGQRLMRSLLENVGQLYSNVLFLGNLFDFLTLQPKMIDRADPVPAPKPILQGIRFDRVRFSYPGSPQPTLKDFSLNIPAGRIVAIVGLNGAGKTTLVKLLCRFYDPDEGSIELDGIDLRDLPIQELRRQMTVLFQEPVRFNTTVAESIALGDSDPNDCSPDAVAVKAAALVAGADEIIQGLPQGYDTPLGKWFANGVELSAGEWQRLALARAFFRQAPILLLDEPTSAMDPWAEAEWLERFLELAEGRTTLMITHRFTTAMRADVIHVMEEGSIVESGSHEELLRKDGRYAASWAAQMRKAVVSPRIHALPVQTVGSTVIVGTSYSLTLPVLCSPTRS
jgi:ATP-binding cassette, subfamily B, bacterial